jgi:hypothetical protein
MSSRKNASPENLKAKPVRSADASLCAAGKNEPQVTASNASPEPQRISTPGWYELSEDAYHGDPCALPSLSSHVAITLISKSLLHAWRKHPRSPLFEASTVGAAADRGSAAHALLFGGKAIEAITADDFRTIAAREARDAARAAGRIPMLAREIEDLAGMTEPARQRFYDLHGGAYLCEQSAIWRQASALAQGWRRARMDTLSASRQLIVDYKTTEGAVDALSCERRIADMGLQIQAAAYVDAVETLHPELQGRVRFIFQWQEQKAPYALSPPIEMSEAFLSLGRAQWKAAGRLWDMALKHNAFPGHSPHRFLACPPPWELSRWEERQLSDDSLREVVQ